MKILIECYGTFINETQSVDLLDVGQKITFDFFGESLEIVLDRVTSYYYEVSTSHHFSIEKDGKVNMYKIKKDDIEGYIYSKYLVKTKDEANKNYDEAGIYQTHSARTNKLGGGDGASLDYYPVEKLKFENNTMR